MNVLNSQAASKNPETQSTASQTEPAASEPLDVSRTARYTNEKNHAYEQGEQKESFESVYYLTTELVSSKPLSEIMEELGILPQMIEMVRYFTSGQFVFHSSSNSWINYSAERVRFVFIQNKGWIALFQTLMVLQAVDKACFCLFHQPSEWILNFHGVSQGILRSRPLCIKFVPQKITVGCHVEAKVTFMLYTVKAVHEDEVLLSNDISTSVGSRREKVQTRVFLLPKSQVFPHPFVERVDPKTQKLFETAMGLGIRERMQTGERLLAGEFTRGIPRIPALAVQLLKSVASEDDKSGYAEIACCRLGNYYSDAAEKLDYKEAERWYQRAVDEFKNVNAAYELAILAEEQGHFKRAIEIYKKCSSMGSASASVALAEYAMSGRINAPDYGKSFKIIRNLNSRNSIPEDDSAKLLMVYLLDRDPVLRDGAKLSETFEVHPELQCSMMLMCIEYHLVKLIFICQAVEERVKPKIVQTIPPFFQIAELPEMLVSSDRGDIILLEYRGYFNIDKLIYLCTTREKKIQIYDDFLLANEQLARKEQLPSAIVFEIISSLYGLLGRPIVYARAKFFIYLPGIKNKAIEVLRAFVNSRSALLLPYIPQILVDLILEYEFSIMTKTTPLWPGEKKNICVAIKRVKKEAVSSAIIHEDVNVIKI